MIDVVTGITEQAQGRRTFVVTGGNSGLGFECASVLAQDSSNVVVVACRDVRQGEQAVARMKGVHDNVTVLPLDLADQGSIRRFVDTCRDRHFPPLAGLVCNAGGQNVAVPTKTRDGYETTFAVNHLGHYLLTRLMLPDLAADAQITFTSSGTHDPAQRTGMPEPRYTTAQALAHDFEPGMQAGQRRYTTSKLCNIYTSYEYTRRLAALAEPRLHSLRVNAFDPGLMPATALARTYSAPLRFISRYILPLLALFMKNIHSPATSGRRLALLASGSEGPTTGKYFSNGHETRSSVASYDTRNALDLWETSAEMTGIPSNL
ncbi:SDR family NAD(P)-dependent oxidoreductase [Sphingomonas sp. TREG-RG-20F-R18-01]|uniref:SDR family NAD(P)-dependent oxidoreductase n=1 Tax=Sphingomonas sp. TREG-RG-20F-R18-01 TaxID=2914982 RepID=UPI001F59F5BC|nr:SDR family NAD(P)-dependent oxidoreductase [Sphingomonas sp. TREG-RG-20F-R18-01]